MAVNAAERFTDNGAPAAVLIASFAACAAGPSGAPRVPRSTSTHVSETAVPVARSSRTSVTRPAGDVAPAGTPFGAAITAVRRTMKMSTGTSSCTAPAFAVCANGP